MTVLIKYWLLVRARARFNVRALLPLVRESERVVAQTKKDWKSDRVYLCKNKLYFFVFRGCKIVREPGMFYLFLAKLSLFPFWNGRDTFLSCPVIPP